MQVGHGKLAPLKRIRAGDHVAYYAPTTTLGGADRLQSFVSIGVVHGDQPYEADMGNGFVPLAARRPLRPASEAPILPLIEQFDFVEDPKRWGSKFRFGMFEVNDHDFGLIAAAMHADCKARTLTPMMEKTMQPQPQPQLQRLQPFKRRGTHRTHHQPRRERPQAARIGTLWDRFFGERVYEKTPHRVDDMRLFGVYSDYETDAHGAFDITTGVAVADGPATVRIEGGEYLVFTGQGEMPQMVLAVWQAIWHYFDAHPEIRRRYQSDFEAYSGPDQVAIHIGVLTD